MIRSLLDAASKDSHIDQLTNAMTTLKPEAKTPTFDEEAAVRKMLDRRLSSVCSLRMLKKTACRSERDANAARGGQA
jgi:hypothetical protein